MLAPQRQSSLLCGPAVQPPSGEERRESCSYDRQPNMAAAPAPHRWLAVHHMAPPPPPISGEGWAHMMDSTQSKSGVRGGVTGAPQ